MLLTPWASRPSAILAPYSPSPYRNKVPPFQFTNFSVSRVSKRSISPITKALGPPLRLSALPISVVLTVSSVIPWFLNPDWILPMSWKIVSREWAVAGWGRRRRQIISAQKSQVDGGPAAVAGACRAYRPSAYRLARSQHERISRITSRARC